MIFHTILNRKAERYEPEPCSAEHIIELSSDEFASFCQDPLYPYGFLQDYQDRLFQDKSGVKRGLLILGEGHRDGVFVVTEGFDYARYSAHIPNARVLQLQDTYPSLQQYCEEMRLLADNYTEKALQYQREGPYRILLSDVLEEFSNGDFNEELFIRMLCGRKEIELVESDDHELFVTLGQDYIHAEDESQYRALTQEEVKIICAKHVLFMYDEDGEQADFSGCLLKNMDLSHRALNSAILNGAKFVNCRMSGIELCFASCENVKFVGCDMRGITAEEASFRDAEFNNCDLTGGFFTHSDLTQAQFPGSEMHRGSFQSCCMARTGLDKIQPRQLNMDGVFYDEQRWQEDCSPGITYKGIE